MPLSIRFPHVLAAVLCASTLLYTGARAEAAAFCVGTAVELQTALNLAGHNQQDDAIRLRQGVYSAATPASAEADFHLAAMDGLSLSITGGWTAGCASRQRAVGTTRLQAGAGRRAMGLVFPNSSASNVVWIEGLEITQAAGSSNALATCAMLIEGQPQLALFNTRFRGLNCPAGALVRVSGVAGGFMHVGNLEFSDNLSADPLFVVDAGSGLADSLWVHLTLAYNTVTGSDLLLHDRDANSDVKFENSVVWGNQLQAHEGGYRQIELGQQPTAVIRFNRLQAVSPRMPHLVWGNTVGDPGFEPGPRPRPHADSALRNGGQMTDYIDYFVFFDLQGHPRIEEGSVDIGAYEYQPPLFADGFE